MKQRPSILASLVHVADLGMRLARPRYSLLILLIGASVGCVQQTSPPSLKKWVESKHFVYDQAFSTQNILGKQVIANEYDVAPQSRGWDRVDSWDNPKPKKKRVEKFRPNRHLDLSQSSHEMGTVKTFYSGTASLNVQVDCGRFLNIAGVEQTADLQKATMIRLDIEGATGVTYDHIVPIAAPPVGESITANVVTEVLRIDDLRFTALDANGARISLSYKPGTGAVYSGGGSGYSRVTGMNMAVGYRYDPITITTQDTPSYVPIHRGTAKVIPSALVQVLGVESATDGSLKAYLRISPSGFAECTVDAKAEEAALAELAKPVSGPEAALTAQQADAFRDLRDSKVEKDTIRVSEPDLIPVKVGSRVGVAGADQRHGTYFEVRAVTDNGVLLRVAPVEIRMGDT